MLSWAAILCRRTLDVLLYAGCPEIKGWPIRQTKGFLLFRWHHILLRLLAGRRMPIQGVGLTLTLNQGGSDGCVGPCCIALTCDGDSQFTKRKREQGALRCPRYPSRHSSTGFLAQKR